MSIPRQFAAGDPVWYDRALPTLEDFDGDEAAFDQAMADYVTLQNGPQLSDTPNFGIPEQQVTTFNPDGTTSTATRGGLPARFEGMSQSELAANQLNARFDNIAKKQNAGMYSPEQRKMDLLALNSRAQVRPEEMQQAYNAIRADGSPVLADPVLAWMEDILGFAPGENANWSPPPPPDPNTVEYPGGPSPFGPEDTWTVQPDGSLVNQNGDVWIPGGGSLLPNSNLGAPNMQQAAGISDPAALYASLTGGVPGAPLLPYDGPIPDGLPASSGPAPEMTPEEWQALLVSMGIDPNDAAAAARMMFTRQFGGLGGY